jgi:hypothetical protein
MDTMTSSVNFAKNIALLASPETLHVPLVLLTDEYACDLLRR